MNSCNYCGKPTRNKYHCSVECSKVNKPTLTCKTCGKEFKAEFVSYYKKGRLSNCSETCKNRKYKFDENYFSGELTDEKYFTLGQFITSAEIVDYLIIRLYSDLNTLEDINKKLNSSYKIIKSDLGRYKLILRSTKMVSDLIELGITNHMLYQDMPLYNESIWEGMKSTKCYSIKKDINMFKTVSIKIACWIADNFDGKVESTIYKDYKRNSIGCEYIVYWK